MIKIAFRNALCQKSSIRIFFKMMIASKIQFNDNSLLRSFRFHCKNVKHRRIMNQIKFKVDEQKKIYFKFFKTIQKAHSIFHRFRINDANSSHDFLKNSMFNQLNRRKRELSNNDDFEKKISFRHFANSSDKYYWYFLCQLSHS